MPNQIQHKRNATPGAVPAANALAAGELAVNTADGVIYLKRDNGTVVASGAALSHTHSVSEVTGAASLPTTGLTITKTGDFFASPLSPNQAFQFFNIVPAQALQFDNTYVRYSGLWINGWSYTEANWATPQPRLTSLTFDNWEGTTSALSVTFTAALTALSLPAMRYATNLSISNNSALNSLSLPLLYAVGNPSLTNSSISISSNSALTTVSFPALVYALTNSGSFGNINISGSAITTISFPELRFVVNGGLGITGAALTSLSVPLLQYASSSTSGVSINNCTSLTSVSFPSLIAASGSNALSITGCTALTSITLPTDGTLKHIGGNVTVTNNALTTAAVDHLLARLVALDGNGGTILYGSGRSVNISGGTTAAPTNLGSTTTAGSQFVCAGTTCTVNWTGHGYATGDVLRISGITTATNANRYAVITVVNANQFTYTITSQTATGAGTATVVKAGNDAKALVTRGVTLTTN